MRTSVAAALVLVLTVSALGVVEAGTDLRTPVATVLVEDQRENGCGPASTRTCQADVEADPEEPGAARVDAYQRIEYVGVAADFSMLPIDIHILPDAALVLRGDDLYVRNPVFRTLTETWEDSGAQERAPEAAEPALTSEEAGVYARPGGPGALGEERYYGIVYTTDGDSVGYEKVGPFNEPSGGSTDVYLEDTTSLCRLMPQDGAACHATLLEGANATKGAAPEVVWGFELYDVQAATTPSLLTPPAVGAHRPETLTPLARGKEGLETLTPRTDDAEDDASTGPGAPLRDDKAPLQLQPMARPPPAATAVQVVTSAPTDALLPGEVTAIMAGAIVALVGFATTLYSRFTSANEVMESPARQKLLRFIEANPGVCLAETLAHMAMTRTAIAHHVKMLQKAKMIEIVEADGKRLLYRLGARPKSAELQVAPAGILAHPVRAKLVQGVLSASQGLTRAELHALIPEVPERTRNYTIQRLVERGVLTESIDDMGAVRLRLAATPSAGA